MQTNRKKNSRFRKERKKKSNDYQYKPSDFPSLGGNPMPPPPQISNDSTSSWSNLFKQSPPPLTATTTSSHHSDDEDSSQDKSSLVPDPYRISFEASGSGDTQLAYAQELQKLGKPFDMQVGFYEDGTEGREFMPGAEDNIDALRQIEGVRVNTGRDATDEDELSETEYDDIIVRNIMAGGSDGESDTTFEANNPLTSGVMKAQSSKLKPNKGQLHFAASGAPYFKPSTNRRRMGQEYVERRGGRMVDVDQHASVNNLQRKHSAEYLDSDTVKKNEGKRNVGIHGTYTKVYGGANTPSHDLPVPLTPNTQSSAYKNQRANRGRDRYNSRSRNSGGSRNSSRSSSGYRRKKKGSSFGNATKRSPNNGGRRKY